MLATGRVLWIGIALLFLGGTLLWAYIRTGSMPLRDSFSLLGAGLLLTGALTAVVWVIEPMELSAGTKKALELCMLVPVAMILVYLFNRVNKKAGRIRSSH